MNPEPQSPIDQEVNAASSAPQPAVRAGWLRFLLFLVALIPVVFLQGVLAVIIMFVAGVDLNRSYDVMFEPLGIIIAVLNLLTVVVAVWLFRRFLDRQSFRSLGFSLAAPFGRHLVEGILWGVGLILVIFGVTLALGGIRVTSVQFPAGSMLVLAAILIPAAISEELILRGYMLNNLMQSTSRYVALLFISLLFAFFHSFNANLSTMGLVNIVLAGLLLGVYYVHRQNLWLPITLHIAWNYVQGPVLGSPISGNATPSVLTLDFTGSDLVTGGEFGFEASLVTSVVLLLATVAMHFVYRVRTSRPIAAGSSVQKGENS